MQIHKESHVPHTGVGLRKREEGEEREMEERKYRTVRRTNRAWKRKGGETKNASRHQKSEEKRKRKGLDYEQER